MKNKNNRKKEYYIHQIVRENETNQNETNNKSTVVTNVRNVPSYAENVGYHLDPKRYDSLRTHKPKKEIVEEVAEEIVEPVPVVNEPENDYYSAMADEYIEHSDDETIISDVISEDEIEQPLVETPVVDEQINNTPKQRRIKWKLYQYLEKVKERGCFKSNN